MSGSTRAVVIPYPHDLAQVSFAVAGDVIPHEAVRAAAAAAGEGEQGWAALFSDVADVFQGADFGFVNLETPVAPEHSHGTKGVPVRRAGGAARGAEGERDQDCFVCQQPRDGPGVGGVRREPRAPEGGGAAVCRDVRQCGDGMAAGDHRGERDQGGLAGNDALAERQPESRTRTISRM